MYNFLPKQKTQGYPYVPKFMRKCNNCSTLKLGHHCGLYTLFLFFFFHRQFHLEDIYKLFILNWLSGRNCWCSLCFVCWILLCFSCCNKILIWWNSQKNWLFWIQEGKCHGRCPSSWKISSQFCSRGISMTWMSWKE